MTKSDKVVAMEIKQVVDKLKFYMDNFDFDNYDDDGHELFYQAYDFQGADLIVNVLIDPFYYKPEDLTDYHIDFLVDSLNYIEANHLDKVLIPKA